ncbi:MAG TPA: carboxypeptidase-like regulatory domain-containing protein, partial [Bacteroidota bacterium]
MNSTRMYFRLYTMFFVAILSFTLPTRAQQPTGTLKGKVVTTLGEPVVNANVYMKELELGDATSENGTYTIRRIPPGTYTVTVSSLGFASVSRRIDVKQEQTLTEDFTLSEQAIDFPAIVVTGTRSER